MIDSDIDSLFILPSDQISMAMTHMVGSSIGLLSGHASISPFPSFVV